MATERFQLENPVGKTVGNLVSLTTNNLNILIRSWWYINKLELYIVSNYQVDLFPLDVAIYQLVESSHLISCPTMGVYQVFFNSNFFLLIIIINVHNIFFCILVLHGFTRIYMELHGFTWIYYITNDDNR